MVNLESVMGIMNLNSSLNLRGGRVILGVDDDGSVTGITRDRIPARKKIIPPKNVYLFAAR